MSLHKVYDEINRANLPASGKALWIPSLSGHLVAWGTTVPTDATAGYATGCMFLHTDGGAGTAFYVNEGSATSCDFNRLEAGDIALGDSEYLYFGAANDVSIAWDGSNFVIKPVADDTGTFTIGDGTTDMDFKIFMGSTGAYVQYDNGSQVVIYEATDIRLNDDDKLLLGDSSEVTIEYDEDGTDDLRITGKAAAGVGTVVTGGTGAAGAGGATGSVGGPMTFTCGAGGTETTGTGGAGGAAGLVSGAGGATSGAAGTGGAGGAVAITGGAGGADGEGGSGTGGAGGTITLTAGAGGAGNTAGAPGKVAIGAGIFTMKTQTIDMADAAVTLTLVPGTPTGTLMTGNLLLVDANSGATENLLLPPEGDCTGVFLVITNTGGETINVQNDAGGAVLTLETANTAYAVCDGVTWRGTVGVP